MQQEQASTVSTASLNAPLLSDNFSESWGIHRKTQLLGTAPGKPPFNDAALWGRHDPRRTYGKRSAPLNVLKGGDIAQF